MTILESAQAKARRGTAVCVSSTRIGAQTAVASTENNLAFMTMSICRRTSVFKAVKAMKDADDEGNAAVLFESSLTGGYAEDEIIW